MSLAERLERLDPRERRLLRILLLCVTALAVVLVPIGTEAMLKGKRDELDAYKAVIADIIASQPALAKAEQKHQAIVQRYARPAPPLSSFIDSLARELSLDVPESQDRPTVPHGKRYEERAVRLQLRKVGLANLSTFLEKLEVAGLPIVLSKLNIHKRISEPDSYDVELIVSAYDRKELPKSDGTPDAGKAAEATSVEKSLSDTHKEEP
jgi:general secretion pathway protein M